MLEIKADEKRATIKMSGGVDKILKDTGKILKGMCDKFAEENEEEAVYFKKGIEFLLKTDFGKNTQMLTNEFVKALEQQAPKNSEEDIKQFFEFDNLEILADCKNIKQIDNFLFNFCKDKELTKEQKSEFLKFALFFTFGKGGKDNAE